MVRGSSLPDDLRILVDNPKYSDVEIECSDGTIHGCRAILAARSDFLDALLFNQMRETFESTISIPKYNTKTIRVIMEYIYTGKFGDAGGSLTNLIDAYSAADFFQLPEFRNSILDEFQRLTLNHETNSFPELLSTAIDKVSPTMEDHPLVDELAKGVAKIPLESISYDKLSTKGLNYLVRYCSNNEISLAKHEYNLFKFVTLHTASKISPEALESFRQCLPPLEEIKNRPIYLERLEDLQSIRPDVAKLLAPMLEFVDFKLISGKVLTDVIEPLEVVPTMIILDAYRHKVKDESVLENKREVREEFVWDNNFRGPNLAITPDGHSVFATNNIRYNERVRAIQSIESGIHEWDVIIETPSASDWVGICGDGEVLNFSNDDYNSKVWILGSTGHVSNNAQQRPYGSPLFIRNTKVTVHLNMNDRSVAFSVNDVRYPPVSDWNNLPPKVYPLVSMRNNGRFRIHRRT